MEQKKVDKCIKGKRQVKKEKRGRQQCVSSSLFALKLSMHISGADRSFRAVSQRAIQH
jgi:hypothetical protein